MPNETKAGHPLDRQNEIERAIQLEGAQDPDNFKMPDGRTLSEVRQANQQIEDKEYQEEARMVARRTREQSISGIQKGDKLVMTQVGNIIDITEPVISEKPVTMDKSRSTSENVKPLREGAGTQPTAPSGETSTSSGVSTGGTGPTSLSNPSSTSET